jgi:hypothetical protein
MLLVLAGMLWGLQMAVTDDHSAFPAHAYLNLLGFVALFLFGTFYRLNPEIEANRLASRRFGFGLSARSFWPLASGRYIRAIRSAIRSLQSGPFAIFADAIMFTWLVFQVTTSASKTEGRPVLVKD